MPCLCKILIIIKNQIYLTERAAPWGLIQVSASLAVIVEVTTNIGLGYLNCFEGEVRRE